MLSLRPQISFTFFIVIWKPALAEDIAGMIVDWGTFASRRDFKFVSSHPLQVNMVIY